MALSTRHRAAIFAAFNTIMGEEEANALLSEFPAAEHDELVTKGHLRAELAEVRVELADLRTDMRTELADLRTDMRTELADVRTEIAGLRTEIAGLRAEIAHSANRTLVATSGMLIAGMGVAAAIGRAIGT